MPKEDDEDNPKRVYKTYEEYRSRFCDSKDLVEQGNPTSSTFGKQLAKQSIENADKHGS